MQDIFCVYFSTTVEQTEAITPVGVPCFFEGKNTFKKCVSLYFTT